MTATDLAHLDAAERLHRLSEEFGPMTNAAPAVLGQITEVSGGRAVCTLARAAIDTVAGHDDLATRMAGQVGSQVKTMVDGLWVVSTVRAVRLDAADSARIIADLDFVGEGKPGATPGSLGEFKRGITRYPIPGSTLSPVTLADVEQIFSAKGRPHIEIGAVYPTDTVRASLFIDPLLGKHFALLGSTGTGKSTTTALLLHRIIEQAPNGHILMLDPHGEYAKAFSQVGAVYDVNNLELPYWLMNFDEHVEVLVGARTPEKEADIDILQKCLAQARSKSRIAADLGKVTVDSPLPYLLSDLLNAIQTNMGKLDKPEKVIPYLRLKAKLEELKGDPRYSFMFSGLLVQDNFADFLSRIFRMPGNGKPISIIDLSGVPSDIVNVVVAVLSRLVFDFAIWSRFEPQRPILLVCEEAHRYVPAERLDTFGAARKVLERIAKEGRKYGVSLGLVSQRPSDLSESVLSQCGTIISMRLNNDRDQAYVRNAMPEGARGFLDAIPSLRNRECIICGEGVAIPIRARLDDLEPEKRPASEDPVFSDLWASSGGEGELIQRTIRRWRTQSK